MSKKWLRFLPAAAIVALILIALVAGLYLKRFFHKDEATQKKMVQQITMMNPPPPPPPPPPKEEIKEPEVKEEPIKEETEAPPQDSPEDGPDDQASPDATPGEDAFNQRRFTRPGGPWSPGGYEQHVRQEINEFITENERLKHMDYVATLKLKIGDGGEIEQYEVEIVSGDQKAGDLIRKILKDKRKLAKPRPLEAPSVVKLRVKSVL